MPHGEPITTADTRLLETPLIRSNYGGCGCYMRSAHRIHRQLEATCEEADRMMHAALFALIEDAEKYETLAQRAQESLG